MALSSRTWKAWTWPLVTCQTNVSSSRNEWRTSQFKRWIFLKRLWSKVHDSRIPYCILCTSSSSSFFFSVCLCLSLSLSLSLDFLISCFFLISYSYPRYRLCYTSNTPTHLPVISLCGRTSQTETAMWENTFYSATITLVPQVTLVLHGLHPLHPLYNIHLLLHNIWHPLSFEQIPLIQIFQINHTLIKTINLQLFLSPWKTLRLFTMIHSHNNNYSLFFHTQFCFCLFLTSVKNSVGLKLLLHILINWIIWNLLISIFITLNVHILCENTSKLLKYNYKNHITILIGVLVSVFVKNKIISLSNTTNLNQN